jgi:hypothetical protein
VTGTLAALSGPGDFFPAAGVAFFLVLLVAAVVAVLGPVPSGGEGEADPGRGDTAPAVFSILLSEVLFFKEVLPEVALRAAEVAAASASAPNILARASAYAFSLSSAVCFSFFWDSFFTSLSLFGFLFIIVIFFATGAGASMPASCRF